jgi:hypothetical protein
VGLPLALRVEGDASINGNVGIGTISPANKLTIADFQTQSDNYIQINTIGGTGNTKYKAGIKLKHSNEVYGFTIQSQDTQPNCGLNILRHDNSSDGISALFIDRGTGNVGVGVTEPSMSGMTRTLAVARGSGGIYGIAQNNSGSDGWRMSLVTEGQERMTIKDNGQMAIRSSLLELLQTGDTPPSIRFHSPNRWWRRIHADSNGFHFKDGDTNSQNYAAITASDVSVKGNIYCGNNNEKPIVFRRYTNLGDNISFNTGISSNDYSAAIAGFRALNGDIQEGGAGDIIQVYMYINNNSWFIRADFRSQAPNENWHIDVMFVSQNLCRREGY